MVAAVTSNGSARNLHSMEGKVAFITGGASGIGLSTARECARRGASIAIVDLRKEAAQKAADELNREYAVPTLALGCNVAVQSEVQAAVDQCMSELGGLHMALNAAGMPSKGVDFADYPVDEFRRVIDVHLIGCFLCCRAEITAMIKSGSGSIVVRPLSFFAVGELTSSRTSPRLLDRSLLAIRPPTSPRSMASPA